MHVQYMVRLVSNVMTFPVFIQGHVSAFLHCGIGLVDIWGRKKYFTILQLTYWIIVLTNLEDKSQFKSFSQGHIEIQFF